MLTIADGTATKGSAAISDRTANNRRGTGKPFVPGVSGNPTGRPKRTPEELDLIAACKAKTPEALAVIADLMATGDDRIRLAAALAIIERGFGRPTQPTTLAGGAGGPVLLEAVQTTDWVALRRSMAERGKPNA